MSRAQFRLLNEGAEEVAGPSPEEQAAIHRRDDGGHAPQGGSHLVKLIGNEPFSQAYRTEWSRLPLTDIPGYREVYRFGNYTFGADTLFRMLDALREGGISEIQLDTLRRYAQS